MPKFVNAGPVVPDELVQALEEDRVVIFCGAGISMGAGLPSYGGLVEFCYERLAEALPAKDAQDWAWPDRMLGALEGKYGAQRVRAFVYQRLTEAPTTLDLHKAILRLAKLRGDRGTRLITTNFDTLFELAQGDFTYGRTLHSGPILPIPRNDKAASWRSVVYLHGRLDEGSNDHLVLTSADFGRAYLTDAWAARFVARLFSDFTVLFIGYSLNDPVLRYMTDAFAAENTSLRGGQPRSPAYIFIPSKIGTPDAKPFAHRNLVPIFYQETTDHEHLRDTIIEWADAREDYLLSTSRLITDIGPKLPASITPSDAANLVWAVCSRTDDAGHGARTFANLNPPPPLEWFEEFERRDATLQKAHSDAVRAARAEGEPAPAAPELVLAPLFLRVIESPAQLSAKSAHLARWLVAHMGDYGLAARIIPNFAQHRRLHPDLIRLMRGELRATTKFKPGLTDLWQLITTTSDDLLATGRGFAFDLRVPTVLSPSGDELVFKLDLLSALSPSIELTAPFETLLPDFDSKSADEAARGARLSEVANAKVVILGGNQVPLLVERLMAATGAPDFLASLLPELTSLLRRTMDLFSLTKQVVSALDISAWHRPSIAPHGQNRGYEKWTVLIDLIWTGWQQLDQTDPIASRRQIGEWLNSKHIVLQRIALAAMRQSPHFSAEEKMEALING